MSVTVVETIMWCSCDGMWWANVDNVYNMQCDCEWDEQLLENVTP